MRFVIQAFLEDIVRYESELGGPTSRLLCSIKTLSVSFVRKCPTENGKTSKIYSIRFLKEFCFVLVLNCFGHANLVLTMLIKSLKH